MTSVIGHDLITRRSRIAFASAVKEATRKPTAGKWSVEIDGDGPVIVFEQAAILPQRHGIGSDVDGVLRLFDNDP